MVRKIALVLSLMVCITLVPVTAFADDGFSSGAWGVWDPYFPFAGNGGYDAQRYLLDLKYDPATDFLSGSATITAKATQNLTRFNFDFEGLTIRSITVNGNNAVWYRSGGELVIKPQTGLLEGKTFKVVVRYDGVPQTIGGGLGTSGFIHTDDGAVVAGQPQVAATWFPVNDHPSDKASYIVKLTVPQGLEAISNGKLSGRTTRDGWTTWTWRAQEPMASYMVTAAIGEFNVHRYSKDGIQYWDAIDPDLFGPVATPRTGTQFAISQIGDLSYKRLARTVAVPAAGAQMSFWVTRDIEQGWDHMFVEAHTVGQDDWTTLRDTNGHTSQNTGFSCPFWLSLHPFLAHYQTAMDDSSCSSAGTSGEWWAATGSSDGYEQWSVDLSAWAGKDVEVSISYVSDDVVQWSGVFVDDIVVSTGTGTTSFEKDGNVFDGWKVAGAPVGSEANANDWIAGTVADTPPPLGGNIQRSFDRQPQIIAFLSGLFGKYPFSTAGGIVDDTNVLDFALETQTRPIYSKAFFRDQLSGDSVIVHEVAHQWVGDNLAVAKWRDIWLNEGFATYAEWLWSEHEGLGTAQEIFDSFYNNIPAEDPFWSLKIGDPGPVALFDSPVYYRGAMTLHQLRLAVGDDTFFKILRQWTESHAGGNVTIEEFIALAEQVSGKELSPLFDTWLFSTEKPVLTSAEQARASAATSDMSKTARMLLKRVNRQGLHH